MDHFDQSPLNKAHFYERKAKGYSKKLLYDEAINCHAYALTEFEKALKCTDNSKAVESIKLQIEYNQRQKDYLKFKKLQHQAYVKAVKMQKEAMSRIMKAGCSRDGEMGRDEKRATISAALFKTISDSDSLLDELVQRVEGSEEKENDTEVTRPEGESEAGSGEEGEKKSVRKVTDLQSANSTLRGLIAELMYDIMSKEREVDTLEKKIVKLEAKISAAKSNSGNILPQSSHFALSSIDEIVRTATAKLPNLPPLELPEFDYAMFHSQDNESKGLGCSECTYKSPTED